MKYFATGKHSFFGSRLKHVKKRVFINTLKLFLPES